jgi:peptidoglycan/LPS O-acetylase OafA/YrhL
VQIFALSDQAVAAQQLHPAYRPDIDGLRAIAVLSVLAFHAFPDLLPGGFVGVDVFFVISGYLISTIILSNLKRGTFSFVDFYSRRVKRIFPALLIVLAACYALGWNSLFMSEFKSLNKHIVGGVAFISNLVLWRESGYFDVSAEIKPLLHLWSLGIEEQYYLFWPLALWCAFRLRFNVLVLIALFGIASFAFNVMGVSSNPVLTFYSPHTRVWELLIGSALAWRSLSHDPPVMNSRMGLEARSVVGCLLILVSICSLSSRDTFPGWWAVAPTMGAMLLISAGQGAWLNRVVLSNRVLVWFGLISFPLYLWHWPLISFARILHGSTPSAGTRLVALLLSILLAWLTYRFIETPIRKYRRDQLAAGALVFVALVVGSISLFSADAERKGGLPRTFLSVNPLDNSGYAGGDGGYATAGCGIADRSERRLFGTCSHDRRGPARYALWGDSKAAALYPGLLRTSLKGSYWTFIGGNGRGGTAVPVVASEGALSMYRPLSDVALKSLASDSKVETVVLVTATRALFLLQDVTSIEELPRSENYARVLEGLTNSVTALLAAQKKVVLVIDNPTFPDPTMCMHRRTVPEWLGRVFDVPQPVCEIAISRQLELSRQYRQALEQVARIDPDRVAIFDTIPILCESTTRMCRLDKDGRLMYSYTDHISDYAAGVVGKELNEFLARF